MTELTGRFLRYVQIDTQSSDASETSPTTQKQHDLAALLAKELEETGATGVRYDKEHCYVYASVPANNHASLPAGARPYALGLIAHMDTTPDVRGDNVRPRIVEHYDGGDIVLREKTGDDDDFGRVVLSPREFPALLNQQGNDLIVTDGTTLLGADDKCGVAEIMELVRFLTTHPEVPHGEIRVAFTPDEEVGAGTRFFDLDTFAADGAFTVDGGGLGQLEYENFNAAEAQVCVNGINVHPGSAKGRMKNAMLVAFEYQHMLPVFMNPMYTEKREGFIHLNQMRGTVEKTVMHYILRDHDAQKLEEKKEIMRSAAVYLNEKYGEGTVDVLLADVYKNMIEKIRPHMHLVENARRAMEALGIVPSEEAIRGGTDGAWLSFRGLPCPNLCTGGYNYHSRYEYASVQEMEQTLEILKQLAVAYASVYVDVEGNTVTP